MLGTSDSERRRSPWQAVAAALVIVLALAAVAGLVVLRHLASRPQHAQGSVVGSVGVEPGFNVRCSLPVTAYGRTAALISFPDGTVTIDHSVAAPTSGKGFAAYSFDSALKKWLPVQHQWVAPDGRSYAFTTTTTGLPGQPPTADVRVRDAATGKERTVWKGDGNASLIGWSGNTLYFMLQAFGGPAPVYGPEIWAVDANGTNLRRVGPNPPPQPPKPGQAYTSYGGGGYIGAGAIWSMTMLKPMSATPPTPGHPVFAGPDTVTRMDLGSGKVTNWYTAPEGQVMGLIGIDSEGRPVVSQNTFKGFTTPPPPGFTPPPPRYYVVTGQNHAEALTALGDSPLISSLSNDSHGTWFTAPGQLWLYSSGHVSKVADIPERLFPAPTPPPGVVVPSGASSIRKGPVGPYLQIAGPCA